MGVDVDLQDFHNIGQVKRAFIYGRYLVHFEEVPLLLNLSPHGPYQMVDLDEIGGVPIVMKELLEHGFLHGGAMTVQGKTMAECLADTPRISDLQSQKVTHNSFAKETRNFIWI